MGTMCKLCSSTCISMTHLCRIYFAAAVLSFSPHAIKGMCTEDQHCAVLHGWVSCAPSAVIARDQNCKFLICISHRHHHFDFEHIAGAHWKWRACQPACTAPRWWRRWHWSGQVCIMTVSFQFFGQMFIAGPNKLSNLMNEGSKKT